MDRPFRNACSAAVGLALLASMTSCGPRAQDRIAECGWTHTLHTFLDTNRNGHVDPAEPPLAGIPVTVTATAGDVSPITPTDSQGNTDLFVMLWGCPEATIAVSVAPPSGLQATTPTEIDALHLPVNSQITVGFAPPP